MDKLTKKGLDGTQLKTIALALMVLDHIHYFFEFTGCIPTVFSMLGRLSAPLFLFCTVEGFAHTHDRKRYFIRIWAIGTAMAALEFFMIYAKAFRRGDGFYPLNAIFQDLMLLCIVWQGIDWLREKKFAKGIGAIAAVLCWPYVVVVFLLLFPQVQEMPIASTVVAFVITSPLPMWSSITDGGWSFLLGGVLLYALRGRRKVQLTVWALVIFLCDFVLPFGMACRQAGFVWTQMFTDYYEWFGVAAVLLMLLAVYAGYALWDNQQVYAAAAEVRTSLLEMKPAEDGPSFAALRAVNPDVCAWVTLDGTGVDYPVVQGTDNLTYVNTDVYGNFSLSGSIFLDSRCAPDFTEGYGSVRRPRYIPPVLISNGLPVSKRASIAESAAVL